MSLTTPERIRRLQRKLYVKAKVEPTCRFHQLYDKVYRVDILEHAYRLAKSQNGAPGVDGVSFADIAERGEGPWLAALRKELHDKTYALCGSGRNVARCRRVAPSSSRESPSSGTWASNGCGRWRMATDRGP